MGDRASGPRVEVMRPGVKRLCIHADEKALIEGATWIRS
jgi:hypothetical protein